MNEKDLEPQKNMGIGLAFFILGIMFLLLGFEAFDEAPYLKYICIISAVVFEIAAIYLHLKYRRRLN